MSGRLREGAALKKELDKLADTKQRSATRDVANAFKPNTFSPGGAVGGNIGANARNSLGGPNRFPRILFYGLKFASMDDIQVSYTAAGNLIYTANFNVDEVASPSS